MFKLGIFCPVLYIKKSHLALSLFFLLIKGRKKSVFSKVLKLRIGGRSVSVSAAIYDQLNQPPQICIRLLAEEIRVVVVKVLVVLVVEVVVVVEVLVVVVIVVVVISLVVF